MVKLINHKNLSCMGKEENGKLEQKKEKGKQIAIPRVRGSIVNNSAWYLRMIIWCFEENLTQK